MNPQTPDNEVIDLSPPQEWLYKCDCPQCRVGAHYNKDIAESYRKRGGLNNEVARLREEANNWHQHYRDEASKAQKCKQAYIEQEKEVARLCEENAALKQGKVFVDPKWIYNLETQLAKAHEELCQAGLREYGN